MSNDEFGLYEAKIKRQDDRRNKSYGKRVMLSGYIKLPDTKGRYWYSASHLLHEEIEKQLKPLLPDKAKTNLDSLGYSDSMHFTIKHFTPADKPSKIISDDEAREKLLDDETLKNVLASMLDSVKAGVKEQKDEMRMLHATQHALTEIAKEIKKKAKDTCRFEQKLAALKAEFKAEVLAQLPNVLEEWLEHMESSTDYPEKSRKLVTEHVEEHTVECCSTTDRFFQSSNTPWIESKLGKDK